MKTKLFNFFNIYWKDILSIIGYACIVGFTFHIINKHIDQTAKIKYWKERAVYWEHEYDTCNMHFKYYEKAMSDFVWNNQQYIKKLEKK